MPESTMIPISKQSSQEDLQLFNIVLGLGPVSEIDRNICALLREDGTPIGWHAYVPRGFMEKFAEEFMALLVPSPQDFKLAKYFPEVKAATNTISFDASLPISEDRNE